MAERWVPIHDGDPAGAVSAEAHDYDEDGNPITYRVWPDRINEPLGNPVKWSVGTMRIFWKPEDEGTDG